MFCNDLLHLSVDGDNSGKIGMSTLAFFMCLTCLNRTLLVTDRVNVYSYKNI